MAPLDSTGKFRLVNVAPVFLTAGTAYTVGATFPNGVGDTVAFNWTSSNTAANIVFGQSRIGNGPSPGVLVRPTGTTANLGFPGGSFGGTVGPVAAAPEPGSTSLVFAGGGPVLLGILRRRKIRRGLPK